MRNPHALSNNTFLIREQEMLIFEELIPGKAALTLPHTMDLLALVAPTFPVRSSGLLLCGIPSSSSLLDQQERSSCSAQHRHL